MTGRQPSECGVAARWIASAALALFAQGALAVCGNIPSAYPVYAGTDLSIGNTNTVSNGSTVSPVDVGNFVGSGVRPDNGAVEAATPTLPSIEPAFPTFSGGSSPTVPPSISSGTYNRVTANNGAIFNGNFQMTRMDMSSNATITLTAGDFFIDTLNIANGATINVGGQVRIYVRTSMSVGNNVRWNVGGNAANLRIYLYTTATAQLGDDNQFTGLIYGEGNARIQIGNSNTITGALITSGRVQIGNENQLVFDPTVQGAIGGISTCTGIVVDFRMEEALWNGTAGEVRDSSGRNLHGTRVTTASPTTTTTILPTPAIPTTTGSFCRAGSFDGRAVVRVQSNELFNLSTQYTAMAWIYPTATPASLASILSNDQNYELHLNSSRRINWWWGGAPRELTSSGTVALNTWTHVAVVYNQGSQRIYLNGNQDANTNNQSGTLNPNPCPFHIGGDVTTGSCALIPERNFRGNIDEVSVYNTPLTQAQIQQIMRTGRACNGIAGFRIDIGAGTPNTCVPHSITITALNASGQTLTSYTGTINLSTSTGKGDWSVVSARGTLSDGTADDGAATYTFVAGDNGVITLGLAHTVAANVVATVTDSALASTQTNSAQIAYRDNAVVVSENESAQFRAANTSGQVVAGRPHRMKVELWTRSAAGLCSILNFTKNNVASRIWLTLDASHVAGASLPGVSAAASCAGQVALGTAVPGTTTLNLNFAAGTAGFYLCPSDVGKYVLNARVVDSALPSVQDGASAMLTARPFALAVSNIRSGANTASSGSLTTDPAFVAAGRDFSAALGAYAWTAGADAQDAGGAAVADGRGDGLPDNAATLAQTTAGGLLVRFAGTATLGGQLNTPSPGSPGLLQLSGATADIPMTGGAAAPSTLSYNEVGSFRLIGTGAGGAAITNYLGSAGVNLAPRTFAANGAQNPVVGRFIPAEFRASAVTLTNRVDLPSCAGSPFTYLGEPLRLQLTLSARSAGAGAPVTANYQGTFARLSPLNSANLAFGAADGATNLTGGLGVSCTAGICGTWASGSASVSADLTVARSVLNACTPTEKPVGPFESVVFGMSPVDADAVAMQVPFDFDRNGDATLDGRQLALTRLRFGRLHIGAAYGTDYLDLPVPLEAQYWNGFAFVRNTLDSCTSLQASNVALHTYSPAGLSAQVPHSNVVAGGVFSAGRGTLTLRKPLTRTGGSLTVCADLDSGVGGDTNCQAGTPAATTYLQARGACGVYDRDPSARAAFGLHKSPDGFLHFRENF